MNLDFTIINHPVHIMTHNNKLSPSAFIPFCEFGGNMSSVGVKIKQFAVPVCNSFQAKILNDQLCYEVDLKKFSDGNNNRKKLKLGFSFILDYNEDKQVTLDQENNSLELGLTNSFDESEENNHATVYLDTIGEDNFFSNNILLTNIIF